MINWELNWKLSASRWKLRQLRCLGVKHFVLGVLEVSSGRAERSALRRTIPLEPAIQGNVPFYFHERSEFTSIFTSTFTSTFTSYFTSSFTSFSRVQRYCFWAVLAIVFCSSRGESFVTKTLPIYYQNVTKTLQPLPGVFLLRTFVLK